MDVVTIAPHLLDSEVVAVCDFLSQADQGERDIMRNNRFAVFNREDKVVVSIIRVVVCFQHGHALAYYWKPNVSRPSAADPSASRGAMGVV